MARRRRSPIRPHVVAVPFEPSSERQLLAICFASRTPCCDLDIGPARVPTAGVHLQLSVNDLISRRPSCCRPLLPSLHTTRVRGGVAGWGLVRTHAADAARVLPRPAPPGRSAPPPETGLLSAALLASGRRDGAARGTWPALSSNDTRRGGGVSPSGSCVSNPELRRRPSLSASPRLTA